MEHRVQWPDLWRRCSRWVIASARWQVFVTPRQLCIVMDYATAGELFEYVKRSVRLREDSARYFFQQLARPCLLPASAHHCGVAPPRISPWLCLLRRSAAGLRAYPTDPTCHRWHAGTEVQGTTALTRPVRGRGEAALSVGHTRRDCRRYRGRRCQVSASATPKASATGT